MPFLVRKLNKRDQISKLVEREAVEDIYADVPTCEFRTTNGSLSTWLIESLDDIDNAVLAIAVSSSQISKMDFIVIDTSILDQNGLEYKQTYAGIEIPIADLQNTHYDILDISLKKLINCANVYKIIYSQENDEEEKFIKRFTEVEIKGILKKAISDKRVDVTKASKSIRKVIEQLSVA